VYQYDTYLKKIASKVSNIFQATKKQAPNKNNNKKKYE